MRVRALRRAGEEFPCAAEAARVDEDGGVGGVRGATVHRGREGRREGARCKVKTRTVIGGVCTRAGVSRVGWCTPV